MAPFDLITLRIATLVAAACFGLGILGLAVAWVASRFSATPDENWRAFYAEFRRTVRSDLLFWRDLWCVPITGFRIALRRYERRRRTQRRAD